MAGRKAPGNRRPGESAGDRERDAEPWAPCPFYRTEWSLSQAFPAFLRWRPSCSFAFRGNCRSSMVRTLYPALVSLLLMAGCAHRTPETPQAPAQTQPAPAPELG